LRTASLAEGPDGYLPEISGTVPSPFEMPAGCRFAPRCADVRATCQVLPPLRRVAPGHEAACVLVEGGVR
jgi:peptide/nickel transport system ATP-binding protein